MKYIMKNKKIIATILLHCFLISSSTSLFASWTLKNGRLIDKNKAPTLSAKGHYDLGMESLRTKDYKKAANNFNIVVTNFPLLETAEDANYFLGVSYFMLEEFDFANQAFSEYISAKSHPEYFIEAIEYKFCIAEAFKKGACRRPFGTKQLPKWASGQGLALTIYDEVIAALPSHDFAAKALYSKAQLLLQMKQYRESVECLQHIIKRFPKHELARESYLMITNIYFEQNRLEFQNPDILAFAEINVRRFKEQFPRDEKISEAESILLSIKESYAKGLYETGQFYERVEEKGASIIYYQNAIMQFPDTSIAKLCEARLSCLIKNYTPPSLASVEESDLNRLEGMKP